MKTNVARRACTRIWIAGAVFMAATIGVAMPEAETKNPPVLRSGNPQLKRVIARGLARSATLRGLVAELEQAHVIAYVAISRDLPTGVGGRTRFIGTGGDWRFVRIEVDDRRPPIELLALLGHELQHAAEIAAAPGVVDATSMAALYDQIGLGRMKNRGWGNRPWYETQAAIDTEHRVYSELFAGGW